MPRISTGFSGRLWRRSAARAARTARFSARWAHVTAALGMGFGTKWRRTARVFSSKDGLPPPDIFSGSFCVGICGNALSVVHLPGELRRGGALARTCFGSASPHQAPFSSSARPCVGPAGEVEFGRVSIGPCVARGSALPRDSGGSGGRPAIRPPRTPLTPLSRLWRGTGVSASTGGGAAPRKPPGRGAFRSPSSVIRDSLLAKQRK